MRPAREPARNSGQTYFVSFQTAKREVIFRKERAAALLLNTILRYRDEYQLHDFVIREDHVHLLITPAGALERSIQLIKGGFSFHCRKSLGWNGTLWQPEFSDHRIRDTDDFEVHRRYIAKNVAETHVPGYRFCGTHAEVALDEFPQRLKPLSFSDEDGGAEAPPLQSTATEDRTDAA